MNEKQDSNTLPATRHPISKTSSPLPCYKGTCVLALQYASPDGGSEPELCAAANEFKWCVFRSVRVLWLLSYQQRSVSLPLYPFKHLVFWLYPIPWQHFYVLLGRDCSLLDSAESYHKLTLESGAGRKAIIAFLIKEWINLPALGGNNWVLSLYSFLLGL